MENTNEDIMKSSEFLDNNYEITNITTPASATFTHVTIVAKPIP